MQACVFMGCSKETETNVKPCRHFVGCLLLTKTEIKALIWKKNLMPRFCGATQAVYFDL